MKLYFDIGNTDIKLNYSHNNKEQYVNFSTRTKMTIEEFYQELPSIIKSSKIDKVFICSVVLNKKELLIDLVNKYWQLEPVIISLEMKVGVEINTSNPSEVGADLISLASFVTSNTSNGIIVNLGTTTTITYIKDNVLQGVVIAPGFGELGKVITNNTSQIEKIELIDTELQYGLTTQDAISIGVIQGHAEMIKGLVNRIEGNPVLFVSGGYSKVLINKLKDFTYVKEATIQGMKHIEILNQDNH